MCGRYVIPDAAEIERFWHVGRHNLAGQKPLWKVAPTTTAPMLRLVGNKLELVAARWGFIPFWWKEVRPARNTHNARSEEALKKAMWRIPAGKSRCLVPAMGWYEWKEVQQIDRLTGEVRKTKQPYFIRLPDRQPIAFAGLMSRRPDDEGKPQFTFTILTRDAVGSVAEIHSRMPIALPKDAEAAWLLAELTDPEVAIEFARKYAITELAQHPADPRVNDAKDEGADLIEPFPNPA
jgi:putative SOS response-associated peptidase YedK